MMLAFRFFGMGQAAVLNRLIAFACIFAAAAFLTVPSLHAATGEGGKRIALVIANGAYPDANTPSASAGKDAALLAEELRRNRFAVDIKQDVSKQDMQDAIDSFTGKITPGTTALLYFNGFGIQVSRQSYLIPVNAQIWSESEVKRDGISIDAVLAEMNRKGANVKIVIIDASRRNPFERRFRPFSAGLASTDAPEGTLAMFAAAPGKVSKDGTGDVSLFMSELVKELRSPDISAEEAFTHTRIGVSRASNGEQVPWVASSLVDSFSFSSATDPVPPVPPVTVTPQPGSKVKTAEIPVEPPKLVEPPKTPEPPKYVEPPKAVEPTKVVVAPPKLVEPPKIIEAPVNGQAVQNTQIQEVVIKSPVARPPQPAELKAGDVVRDCPECPELIVLPAGSYTMGTSSSPYEKPVHRVTIPRPIAMGRSPITFNDWNQCVLGGGCKYIPKDQGWGTGDRPVINISWSDTKDYIAWLSQKSAQPYRLPTEAEWEYGARGGVGTTFYWGPSAVGLRMANCQDCGAGPVRQTVPVRSFQPNGFGLFDMGGNVAQWVEDCWNDNYKGAPRDGSAWETGQCSLRVLRGGSFGSASADIKPTARFRYDLDVRYYANGFRVVRDVP